MEQSESRTINRESRLVEGIVRVQLPNALYDVEIDSRHRVTAHVGGGIERNFIRVLVGDWVVVELAKRDATRGRIVRKARS